MEVAKLTLTLGAAQREFFFRKNIADEAVVLQALKMGAYNFERLQCGPELIALYKRLAKGDKAPLIIDAAADIGAAAVFFAHEFPEARIVAFEPEPAKFQLLTANTVSLPVECVQAAVGVTGGDDATAPRVAIGDIYRNARETQPFILKFNVDADDLFAARAEWVARTPVMIATLNDYLVPGTAGSRAFVGHAAGWDRDFVYLEDNVFSIGRSPELMQAAA